MDVAIVEYAEEVELDFVLLEAFETFKDLFGRALAVVGDAVVVVEFRWAVDGEADEELLFVEEPAPVVVEEGAIGLEGVLDGLAGAFVFVLEFDGFSEEVESGEGGFAALPGDGHFVGKMGDEAGEEFLEGGEGHAVFVAVVDGFGGEVIAVGAVEVAERADGLDHDGDAAGLEDFKFGRFHEDSIAGAGFVIRFRGNAWIPEAAAHVGASASGSQMGRVGYYVAESMDERMTNGGQGEPRS